MNQSSNAVLNRPFEFEEVLVAPQMRTRYQRVAVGERVFSEPNTSSLPSIEAPVTRKLAVRLRTINNACAAPFKMPDGRPITEVSLYGSRDHQFLVGPYWTVKRLMDGELPWELPYTIRSLASDLRDEIKRGLVFVDAFLNDPQGCNTTARISRARLKHSDDDRQIDSPWHPRNAVEQLVIREQQEMDLCIEKIAQFQEFAKENRAVLDELEEIARKVTKSEWWWGWTDDAKATWLRLSELKAGFYERRGALCIRSSGKVPVTKQSVLVSR